MTGVYTRRVAREIGLEMRRQRKSSTELAAVLDVSPRTARRRLRGEGVVYVHEVIQAAQWLGIAAGVLIERAGG